MTANISCRSPCRPKTPQVSPIWQAYLLPASFDLRWPQYQIEGEPLRQDLVNAALAGIDVNRATGERKQVRPAGSVCATSLRWRPGCCKTFCHTVPMRADSCGRGAADTDAHCQRDAHGARSHEDAQCNAVAVPLTGICPGRECRRIASASVRAYRQGGTGSRRCADTGPAAEAAPVGVGSSCVCLVYGPGTFAFGCHHSSQCRRLASEFGRDIRKLLHA